MGGGEKAGGSVGSVGCGVVGVGVLVWELQVCVGAAVVGVRWWVRKVVGHEACGPSNLGNCQPGYQRGALSSITDNHNTIADTVCPHNFP